MKTLNEFFAYILRDCPEGYDVEEAWSKGLDALTPLASYSVIAAADIISTRAGWDLSCGDMDQVLMALRSHPGALFGLSVALLPALEAMRSQVPEAKPHRSTPKGVITYDPAVYPNGPGVFAGWEVSEMIREQNRLLVEIDVAERQRPKAVLYDAAAEQMVEAVDVAGTVVFSGPRKCLPDSIAPGIRLQLKPRT